MGLFQSTASMPEVPAWKSNVITKPEAAIKVSVYTTLAGGAPTMTCKA